MTDDIVTILHSEWAEITDESFYEGCYKGSFRPEVLIEAADEIELLRKALALAVHTVILYAPYRDKSPENLIEFFKEAASHD